jgi:acetoin utilization deacetylase AcuC-like enzyme
MVPLNLATAEKKIGIFYHPSFSRKSFLTLGNRLRDFPEALAEVLKKPHVQLCECPRVSEELILQVHARELIGLVAREPLCSTAYESAGGVVAAMEMLARGLLTRAFCFIGAGGHHAGYNQFWGACCFNDVILALTRVRQISAWRRLAIVDTDAHHGDGTRQLIRDDPEVFHLCFCGMNYRSQDGTKVDVNVTRPGWNGGSNAEYLARVREHLPLIPPFKPDLLLWYYGFDTHRDDYGSLGLTEEAYFELCDLMVNLAVEMGTPLQVVLGGGSLPELATATIPEIIRRLAEG